VGEAVVAAGDGRPAGVAAVHPTPATACDVRFVTESEKPRWQRTITGSTSGFWPVGGGDGEIARYGE
jgi:hypothetical protein